MSEKLYLVKFIGSTRCFIVTLAKRDEFSNPAVFHGIGFWATSKDYKTLEGKEIREVWIPWNKIDHVESLMYRPRS